jgi:hypothetical protein
MLEPHLFLLIADLNPVKNIRNITLSSQFNKLSFQNRHQHVNNFVQFPSEQTAQRYQHEDTLRLMTIIARELLDKGHSETAQAFKVKKHQNLTTEPHAVNATASSTNSFVLSEHSDYKDRLLYLGDLIGFEVIFHSLSKVSLFCVWKNSI